jgi:hypothetical protein
MARKMSTNRRIALALGGVTIVGAGAVMSTSSVFAAGAEGESKAGASASESKAGEESAAESESKAGEAKAGEVPQETQDAIDSAKEACADSNKLQNVENNENFINDQANAAQIEERTNVIENIQQQCEAEAGQ